ncbi:MAG TPA: efflux transporter outer membrane subunit [Albitalea sp.]|nr:efflux transporter outer membrane subunit [Albitalea sp.]
MNKTLSLAPLVAALLLAGCASTPVATPTAPPAIPAEFKEAAIRWSVAPPAEAQPRGAWWKAFGDPLLDDLVERAASANTSIAQAAARLAQARAVLRATDAERAPQASLGAGVTRQGGVANATGTAGTLASAGANFSYELDLFGRLAKASDAAALDAKAQQALLQSTRLLVQANVAQTYFALRALDNERALMRDTVAAYADTLRLTESRYRGGDVAELDVARVRTEVAATRSEALALERRRAELEHALAVLVGELPAGFAIAEVDWAGAPPSIPAGLPSTLLARRPDVSAAQSAMLAAQARVGVAQAAWFPSLALTASGGYASPELGDLFKWSARAWSIGALLSLPLFDGGRREAGIQGANAQLEGAAASYRENVLVAFRDVEDQLSALRLLNAQADMQTQAVASASRATVLSDSRYRNGLVSQLELLDARRSEANNRRQAVQVRAAQYQATIGLIRALGGGWAGG